MSAINQEIQEKETRLQDLQNERETAKQHGQDNNVMSLTDDINAISNRLNELYAEREQENATQVRIQAQEEKVESITLPHKFNEVFDDPRADDIIIEVIKSFQRQANDEHNAEVESLIALHREEVRAAGERELQLKRQNDELQIKLDAEAKQAFEDAIEHTNLLQQIAQLQLDKQDAEAKRDAAVAEKEAVEALLAEKQAHIDTLRDEIAIGASKAINVTAIEASNRLSELVAESKNAKIKSAAEIALENTIPFRGKFIFGDVVAPPVALEEATFQPDQASNSVNIVVEAEPNPFPADHQEVNFSDNFPVSSGTEMANGTPSEDGQGTEATITRAEFEDLKGRVDHLYRVANISEVA